jgi:hypothetical protein
MLLLLHTRTCTHPLDSGEVMLQINSSKVSRWDQHGREHIVHVTRTGAQRLMNCDTCGWRKKVQFLPWLKAEEHLAEEHQATVDPTAG